VCGDEIPIFPDIGGADKLTDHATEIGSPWEGDKARSLKSRKVTDADSRHIIRQSFKESESCIVPSGYSDKMLRDYIQTHCRQYHDVKKEHSARFEALNSIGFVWDTHESERSTTSNSTSAFAHSIISIIALIFMLIECLCNTTSKRLQLPVARAAFRIFRRHCKLVSSGIPSTVASTFTLTPTLQPTATQGCQGFPRLHAFGKKMCCRSKFGIR
jgi:hypothetical protein